MGDIKDLNPALKCDKTDCSYICTDKNQCAILPNRDKAGGCFTYTPRPIEIEVTKDNDINADEEFLEAQKMLLSFVPKNKVGLLYKGLKSKLQYAIDRYVDYNSKKRMESIAEEYKAVQSTLAKRIEYLEGLCDKKGIRHKVTSEDVYRKRKDGFVND